MEENELNLEELFEVNGGQNAAAELLSEIAEERSCLYEDGTIGLASVRGKLTQEEFTRLLSLRSVLVDSRKNRRPRRKRTLP